MNNPQWIVGLILKTIQILQLFVPFSVVVVEAVGIGMVVVVVFGHEVSGSEMDGKRFLECLRFWKSVVAAEGRKRTGLWIWVPNLSSWTWGLWLLCRPG